MLKKQLISYAIPNLAQAIASFGTVAILTRFLSPEEYGRFSLAFSIMTIAHYFVLNWAESAANRFYTEAKSKNEIQNHFTSLIFAFVLNSVIFAILSAIIIIFYPAEGSMKIALAAAFAGSIIRSLLKIILETRRMKLESVRFAIVEASHVIIGFVISAVLVILYAFKEEAAFIATLIASALALAFELPSLLKEAKGGKLETERLKEYFKFGYPISLGLIFAITLSSGDRFLIAYFLGDKEVGIYSAGYQTAARILEIIFAWLSSATFPLQLNAYDNKDKNLIIEASKNSFVIRFGLGAPAAVGIALVAVPLCEILIGPEFRNEAAQIAPWIAVAGLIMGMSDYFSDAFIITKHVRIRVIIMLVPTVLSIALNIILLPKIGLFGAVYATLISYFIGMLLLAIIGRRYLKLSIPIKDTLQITVSCMIMIASVIYLPKLGGFLELCLKASVGGLAYIACAYYFNISGIRGRINQVINK